MEANVIYTSLPDYAVILKLFLWEGTYLKRGIVHKGEKYSFRKNSLMRNIGFVSLTLA